MKSINKDIVWMSILACLWGIQAGVCVEQLTCLWHAPVYFKDMLLQEAISRMAPKWDLCVYLTFITVALVTGPVLMRFRSKPINPRWLIFEAILTFLMVSAVFKIMVYDNSPRLAQTCLVVMMVLAVLSKVFYPETKKSALWIYQRAALIPWALFEDYAWAALIVLMIYIPDLSGVTAMIYMGDWFHHLDYVIMSVGWASLWGQVPYADIISQYGVGLPVIFAKIIKCFGTFDYLPALRVVMWFVILYFIGAFFFVRYWLGPAWIAGVAFLLVFRLQMFHYGVSPLIWCTASASPMRFGLDIAWMTCLLLHMRTSRLRWLLLAAFYSGFAVYYMTSSGMCVMVTLYAYLLSLLAVPAWRQQILSQGPQRTGLFWSCWVLPFVSMLLFFGAALKGHIFQKEYWQNLINYLVAFEHIGALPMWESLKYRHFWAFFMSMAMPLTYLVTLMYIGLCLYIEKGPWERVLPALLSVYGLANYQYYVVRSAITTYYVNALPFVFIVCFWFMQILKMLPSSWQRRLRAAAVILSFYALWTNQNFLAYPNLMSFSRHPLTDNLVIQRFPDRQGYFNVMYKNTKEDDKLPVNDLNQTQEDMRVEDDFKDDRELAQFYQSRADFAQDASLIDRLTGPQERVALISSFETKILIQANRPPFFYDFPMLSSRPMTFRSFPSDAAHSLNYLDNTIKALEDRKPDYVFMERIFLQNTLPASYYDHGNRRLTRVLSIIDYIRAHYQPYATGQYLVAMKRI